MDEITVEITGMAGIEAKLVEMGETWAADAVHKALGSAGQIFRDAISALAPMRTDDHTGPKGFPLPPGALKNDIMYQVFQKTVAAGTSKATGNVGLWVEYGHNIVARGGNARKGRGVLGRVSPHPFIRPAFDTSAGAAEQAFVDSLRAQLETVTPAEGAL